MPIISPALTIGLAVPTLQVPARCHRYYENSRLHQKNFAGADWKRLLALANVGGDLTEVNPWILQIYLENYQDRTYLSLTCAHSSRWL